MARSYVKHAMVISWIYAGVGALLAYQSGGLALAVWPLLGAAIVTAYMFWLYNRALSASPQGNGNAAGSSNGTVHGGVMF